MASAKPCSAPHIINRKLAPCHKPPSNIVVIWLKWLRTAFFRSFATIIAIANSKNAPVTIYRGKSVLGSILKAQIKLAIKNIVGKKYPQKVPFRLPPTEKYK